jgi:hypothetical protein
MWGLTGVGGEGFAEVPRSVKIIFKRISTEVKILFFPEVIDQVHNADNPCDDKRNINRV